MPILVNGQPQSLSSVNQDNSSNKASLKDSVKDSKTGVSQLIETLLTNGMDANIGKNLAPVIGLPKPMPIKQQESVVSSSGSDYEKRTFLVPYEVIDAAAPGSSDKRPVCAYLLRSKNEGLNRQVRYYRIDLTGNLEKSFLSKSKVDKDGNGVRGSGVKTDLDINSPEVKKTFDAEMKFWLKDWLKKQPKVPAKKA